MSVAARLCPCVGLAIAIAVPALQAQPSCFVAPPGLVSWWSGDTNTNDLLGGNNPSETVAVTIVPGEVGGGFSIGKSGYIAIPAAANLANQRFTWSAWVRPDGPGPNNDAYGSVIVQQNVSSSVAAINLLWRATDGRFVFLFGNQNSELILSNDGFAAGSFYFVTVTYDGSAFQLYVNGVLEGSFASTKTVGYSSRVWTIGSSDPAYISLGFARTWNGVIDEVQAYARALTDAEIQAIYHAGNAGVCKGLVLAPRTLVFPNQAVGVPSPFKAVKVVNVAATAVNFVSVQASGDFSIYGSTCAGGAVGPGASCYIAVQFTPSTTGPRSGYLVVESNGAGSPQYVKLSGTGQ